MKIIVREDHRAPVVVSQVWYKVGASYEHDGITGVSHVLEHMMFKGTDNLKPGEFSEIISANGGRENAFTGRDYTAYFQRIASDRLEICLKLEADRMRNLVLTEAEFAKEIEVVKEERRMRTEDNPNALTYERFIAAAFLNNPYRNPVIGWMQDLDSLTVEDARQWYKRWYTPNNATLVVVGDVKAQDVFKLAKKYFGAYKANTVTAPKPRQEIQQKGLRRITVEAKAKLPYLVMGYKAPTTATADEPWEVYALEMLANILDGGDSARFAQRLRRGQEIATRVGAGYDMHTRDSHLFLFDGVPTEKHNVADLEAAIRKEINELKIHLASRIEMDRIKTKVIANKVYERDSMFYMAMQIGTLETVHLSHDLLDQYVKNIKAVTAKQIREVARKYLVDENLTVAVLKPQPVK